MPASDLQISFGGLTTGAGTVYRIRTVTGLRDITVRSADDSTATRWGSVTGADQVESPKVTIEYLYGWDPAVTAALEAAFVPAAQSDPAGLGELAWKWPGEVELFRYARCRRRSRPMTYQTERVGGATSLVVELQAPDPRAYSAALHSEALAPFGDDGLGLDLDVGSGTTLGINLDVGSGTSLGVDLAGEVGGGTLMALNAGNTETWPTVTFTAPGGMSVWRLRNLTTGGQADFAYPLEAGSTFTVDFPVSATPRAGDVVLVDGGARYAAWSHPRTPLALVPGLNELRFDILDGAEASALASVEWRDAHI